MKLLAALPGILCMALLPAHGQIPVLKPSDVVFMYQAPAAIYREYGATVLAWGGTPSTESLAAAQGIKFFGSVGMVTEFNRYHDRFPSNYEAGVCRGLDGKPFKVPWLTDHSHKGIPYWWCCTRQPLFRQYISERVIETVKAGAFGVHIDDHLGTAGALFLGGCFCDLCVGQFPAFLKARGHGNGDQDYHYRDELRRWLEAHPDKKYYDEPSWNVWRVYQLRGAAEFMMELRDLAAKTAGRPVPMSANSGLLWGPHLSDYKTVDFFSAEIDHHADGRKFSETPVVAYRIADAVGRPLAATASGGDWAFIKANNLHGLVCEWIALGYAAGNSLMAPHRQWCYTPEKGTHWYEGPAGRFAPLYRFARDHASLLDGYSTFADLTVIYSQKTFDRNPRAIISVAEDLVRRNISFRFELGSDEVVEHPLSLDRLRGASRLLVLEPQDLTEADRQNLAAAPARTFRSVQEVRKDLVPAVRCEDPQVRLFPRVKPGAAVIHILNWNYDPGRDDVTPSKDLRVYIDRTALGLPARTLAVAHAPGKEPQTLPVTGVGFVVPEAGLWTILELKPAGQ